jgi:hypothetical protein
MPDSSSFRSRVLPTLLRVLLVQAVAVAVLAALQVRYGR